MPDLIARDSQRSKIYADVEPLAAFLRGAAENGEQAPDAPTALIRLVRGGADALDRADRLPEDIPSGDRGGSQMQPAR